MKISFQNDSKLLKRKDISKAPLLGNNLAIAKQNFNIRP
jgi:hypothetical protein